MIEMPCVLLSLDLPAVVELKAEAGYRVTYQQAFDEIREILLEYCIRLKKGEVKLTPNRKFTINFNETVVAQFGFPNAHARKNPRISQGVSN